MCPHVSAWVRLWVRVCKRTMADAKSQIIAPGSFVYIGAQMKLQKSVEQLNWGKQYQTLLFCMRRDVNMVDPSKNTLILIVNCAETFRKMLDAA